MKKTISAILNRPLAVIIVSLIIAIAVGGVFYKKDNVQQQQATVAAAAGSISSAGTSNGSSTQEHLILGFLTSGRIQTVSVAVGDSVKKDQVLATLDPENTAGAITQAQAALSAANANYQKVVNGATGPTIDIAKAAVATAQTALDQVTTQQETLVTNARRKLFSDDLTAVSDSTDETRRTVVPTISGAYNGDTEGQYRLFFGDINVYTSKTVSYRGLETGIADRKSIAEPIGTRGLYITFPDVSYNLDDSWTVDIPNKNGENYAANLNAYQSALQTQTQALASAKANLTQAQASLTSIVSAARPEDVAAAQAQVESARGTLQIAQAAYDSRVIKAPGDGTVSAVHISPGQIAAPNAPAIELSGTSFSKEVAVLIPNNTIINRDGNYYVQVKTASGTSEKQITVGDHDDTNTEVTSGLSAGDEVVVQQ